MDPVDPARRAAALEALSARQTETPDTFWKLHGGKVIFTVALVLGLWLVLAGLGRFLQHSISETARSEEVIRRGVR
jgi:hypothetical protein